MANKSYYTHSSLEKLKNELYLLQTKERKALSEQINQAMAYGDLSENAEYHAAKEAQGLLEIKIAELQGEIAHAKVIDESKINTSSVSILTQVKIKNQQTQQITTYKLVSSKEADIKQGHLSVASPIGKGLLNKKVGDIVTIHIPAGKVTFEVLQISL